MAMTMSAEWAFASDENSAAQAGGTVESSENSTVQGTAEDTEEPGQTGEPEVPEAPDEPVTPKEPSVIPEKLSVSAKSRGTIYMNVKVTDGGGKKLILEYLKGNTWIKKSSVNVPESEEGTADTYVWRAKFSNEWWYETGTKWRFALYEPADGSLLKSGETITVNTQRYYRNPSGYLQIKDKITLEGGGYKLYTGYMGLKVYKVNKYFGIGSVYWPRYTSGTKSRVRAFQRRKGLKATGNVNLETWKKMGYSESSWYKLGAYVTPVRKELNLASTRSDYINAMIRTAESYRGAKFVVGASGRKSDGLDCSGLIMQCMYSAGVSIPGISSVSHSKRGHEYESRNMWKSKYLKRVSYKSRKKGDLIFYQKGGRIIHVALYVGNGKIIHSWPNCVMKSSAALSRWGKIAGVKRIFK